jgi:rhamnosyl/mannosyltransferase
MRVLQVNKYYHPVVGGIERVVQNISEGLTVRGHEVSVMAARKRGCGYVREHNGVSVNKVTSAGKMLSVPVAPSFPVGVAKRASSADVVHYHLPNPLGVISHLLTPDVPTIATYHSDIVRQTNSLRLYRPLLERFLEDVDRILVTSPNLRDNSEILGPYREKCAVVPLSIDVAARDESVALPDESPGAEGEQVVLFVGRLNYYKGVEYLVEAMQGVEANLLIVGDGDRREVLEKRAAELQVSDRVHFLGHVSEEALSQYYRLSDVFVLPSVEPSEAFGLVQLEAMAHGTPVVNTSLPTGVPWVSVDGETGVTVQPRDAEELADAISRLLADQELRERFGENARQRVAEHFSRERMLNRTERIYQEVCTSELL